MCIRDRSERYDPKDFERQVKTCEGDLADRRKAAKPERERMEKARAEWEKKRDVVARKSFDARASSCQAQIASTMSS